MTLVQLRHFIALAQKASFAKAAVQLHLTQPALSRSIRAL
jgi:DNA-binding transcriptional LysR family regulator